MNKGLALCCCVSPIFDSKNPANFTCPSCDKRVGGWSTNEEWIASLWNQRQGKAYLSEEINPESGLRKHVSQPNMKLDIEGWRYAKLAYSKWLPYHEKILIEKDFVLFQTDRTDYELLHTKDGYTCIIDDSRCFKKFKLRTYKGKEFEFNLPQFKTKNKDPFQVYVCSSYSSNGSCWYRLNITAYNQKWCDYFDGAIKELFE